MSETEFARAERYSREIFFLMEKINAFEAKLKTANELIVEFKRIMTVHFIYCEPIRASTLANIEKYQNIK